MTFLTFWFKASLAAYLVGVAVIFLLGSRKRWAEALAWPVVMLAALVIGRRQRQYERWKAMDDPSAHLLKNPFEQKWQGRSLSERDLNTIIDRIRQEGV